MNDRWLTVYESCLKGKPHVISKQYTLSIERNNLRQHLTRLSRISNGMSLKHAVEQK